MNFACLVLVVLLSSSSVLATGTNSIPSLLVNLIAGPSVNLMTRSWPIDPEGGIRRRKEYEAVNGPLGSKYIERLGLGEDGREEERRIQQRLRDQTGQLSYPLPPLKS